MYVDFIAVITSIPVGLMIDKIGRRRKFIIFSTFLFALTHLIFYQLPNCWGGNEVDASILGFLLFGLSNTFYSSGLIRLFRWLYQRFQSELHLGFYRWEKAQH